MKQNDFIKLLKKSIFILIFIPCLVYSQTVTWTGGTNDWNTASNWSPAQVPMDSDDVLIDMPGATVEISSTTAAYAKVLAVIDGSLTIMSGGSLIAHGGIGDITYEVTVSDTLTHTMSSPVAGEQYDNTWVNDNNVGSIGGMFNGGDTRLSVYDNSMASPWQPFLSSDPAATFESSIGYGIGLDVAMTDVSFTGQYPDDDFTPAISQGLSNFNLLGNPYPSYLDIEAFIAANSTKLVDTFQAISVFNGTNYVTLTTGHLHPGQGFFIRSNVASGTVSITQAMQRAVATFIRPATTNPSIKVKISNGTSIKDTQINYVEDKTKGLDPRFDLGMFDETSSDLRIFTHLIEDNKGIAFGIQSLPNSDLESMVVPVGVKAIAGEEITFSVEALNLPTNLKVFLEDKGTNTFTRLDKANTNYTIALSEGLDGIGRFYLHTSKSALTVEGETLNTIHIYKSDISTVRIVGLPEGNKTVKLFNVLGKQVLNTSFDDDAKDISLPKLGTGVYIVDVQTAIGKLNKKIILE